VVCCALCIETVWVNRVHFFKHTPSVKQFMRVMVQARVKVQKQRVVYRPARYVGMVT